VIRLGRRYRPIAEKDQNGHRRMAYRFAAIWTISMETSQLRRFCGMIAKADVTPAILSRNFVARQSRKCDMAWSATSQQSRNSFFPNGVALYSAVQLLRKCGKR